MLSKPWREDVWDSILSGSMARTIMEVEEEGMDDDENVLPAEENKVKGTIMTVDLVKRSGRLKCFMTCVDKDCGVVVKERHVAW